MQATPATTPAPTALPAAASAILVPGVPPDALPPSPLTSEAAAAAFAPEIALLRSYAAWEQAVVEDESSFDSI